MDKGESSCRLFLQGDESAFDDIMKDYFHSLVFFIDQYVHDVHTAEDIAIDVFTYFIVHKNRYNFRSSLKTYLFMLGRSRAIDYLRHNKLIQMTELEKAVNIKDEQELTDLIIKDEQKLKIHRAVEKLPRDMGEVIHLIYFEDLSYEEAGRVMKKNRKQIDNLLYRAKKELRVILTEYGDSI